MPTHLRVARSVTIFPPSKLHGFATARCLSKWNVYIRMRQLKQCKTLTRLERKCAAQRNSFYCSATDGSRSSEFPSAYSGRDAARLEASSRCNVPATFFSSGLIPVLVLSCRLILHPFFAPRLTQTERTVLSQSLLSKLPALISAYF